MIENPDTECTGVKSEVVTVVSYEVYDVSEGHEEVTEVDYNLAGLAKSAQCG